MSYNIYAKLKALFPDSPLVVATVTSISGDVAFCTLPDGAVIQARGAASVGDQVFVRDGVIEGTATTLPTVTIEV